MADEPPCCRGANPHCCREPETGDCSGSDGLPCGYTCCTLCRGHENPLDGEIARDLINDYLRLRGAKGWNEENELYHSIVRTLTRTRAAARREGLEEARDIVGKLFDGVCGLPQPHGAAARVELKGQKIGVAQAFNVLRGRARHLDKEGSR